jgi:ankyrin repeat protein
VKSVSGSFVCFLQNGLNALHLAAKEGHIDVVNELLKRGALVDAATKVSFSSLEVFQRSAEAKFPGSARCFFGTSLHSALSV